MTAQVIRLTVKQLPGPEPWMCGWERRGPQSHMWCRLTAGHHGGCVLRSPNSFHRTTA